MNATFLNYIGTKVGKVLRRERGYCVIVNKLFKEEIKLLLGTTLSGGLIHICKRRTMHVGLNQNK